MDILRIEDRDDPRIAAYRDIREKDLIGREGLFVAEGKFILETLLTRSRFPAVSALVLEERLAPLEPILAHAPDDFPVHVATREVMDAIAGFPVHRGILALGHTTPSDAGPMPRGGVALLAGIANPDNIGTIFRNAAGLGIAHVLLDRRCCDPLYRKAIRVSMGASLVLPFSRVDNAADAVRTYLAAGHRAFALTPSAPIALEQVRFGTDSLFVFGEEAQGLDADVIAQCEPVGIPMAHGTDSLNVSASSAIVFNAWRVASA